MTPAQIFAATLPDPKFTPGPLTVIRGGPVMRDNYSQPFGILEVAGLTNLVADVFLGTSSRA